MSTSLKRQLALDAEELWLVRRIEALKATHAAVDALKQNPGDVTLRVVAQAAIDRYQAIKWHG